MRLLGSPFASGHTNESSAEHHRHDNQGTIGGALEDSPKTGVTALSEEHHEPIDGSGSRKIVSFALRCGLPVPFMRVADDPIEYWTARCITIIVNFGSVYSKKHPEKVTRFLL